MFRFSLGILFLKSSTSYNIRVSIDSLRLQFKLDSLSSDYTKITSKPIPLSLSILTFFIYYCYVLEENELLKSSREICFRLFLIWKKAWNPNFSMTYLEFAHTVGEDVVVEKDMTSVIYLIFTSVIHQHFCQKLQFHCWY